MPNEGKLEARLRGPLITPGYWRQEQHTREAFDAEGYYKIGDALKFADPDDPAEGLLFDGRLAEDYKLSTGTWVSVGPLRARFVDHFVPYVRDVVFAGPDRDHIDAVVFPDIEACRALAELGAEAAPAAIIVGKKVRAKFAELLVALAAQNKGSSTRVVRLILMADPPSKGEGEMTDKGSINQHNVLTHRGALVDELYAPKLSPRVLSIAE